MLYKGKSFNKTVEKNDFSSGGNNDIASGSAWTLRRMVGVQILLVHTLSLHFFK